MNTFRDLIDQWPQRSELGEDIAVAAGTVQQWWTRDSVPPEYWLPVIAAAAKRGIQGVSAETLASIAAKRRAA